MISHSTDPRFPPSAPIWWPTLVFAFWVQKRSKGECKAFCIGGVTPIWEDARVETANVKGKAFHHDSKQSFLHRGKTALTLLVVPTTKQGS
jgi:hypothetical protein